MTGQAAVVRVLGRIVALAAWLFAWSIPAAADLYRWVDPETGSVKFSSYPPPWYGEDAQQRRVPQVERIPAGRNAPARSDAPADDREKGKRHDAAAGPSETDEATDDLPKFAAEATLEARRGVMLELLVRRVAALVAATPEKAARAYSRLLAPLSQLESIDLQMNAANPADEPARLEKRWKLAEPLDAHRTALMRRVSALRPPPTGAAPDAVEIGWSRAQLQIDALESVNEAIGLIDPRKRNAQHFELQELKEKVSAAWQPFVGARSRRINRGT